MKEFSEKLKQLRQEKNFSQWELSKATHISRGLIGNWESGARSPSAENVVILAKFFGCTTDYLLGLDEYK